MSALARYFLALKWCVFGSDIVKSVVTQKLIEDGVKVKIGSKSSNLSSKPADLVIYSQAIKASNLELKKAKQIGIPTLSYPEAAGRLTEEYKTIAVAGAHGKSTTTALIGLMLIKAGFNPTVILGTNLKEFGGRNFRKGESDYLTLEADEWRAAFLHYSPTFTIVTNIDREHLDFYRNLGDIKKTFIKFISRTKKGGVLILNRDNKILRSLKSKIQQLSHKRELKLAWYSLEQPVAKKIKKIIKVSGEHNVSNALAVYTLGRKLKIPEKVILSTILAYRGAWRRMEYRGKLRTPNSKFQVRVYDDYAHHPTEIKATLCAFREKFPKSRIICVFQPHQARRLEILFKDFKDAFDKADILVLLPIYQVAGRDIINKHFTSIALSQAIRKKYPGKPVAYLQNPKNLKKLLTKIVQMISINSNLYSLPHIVVMMGAGDIVKYTDSLIK